MVINTFVCGSSQPSQNKPRDHINLSMWMIVMLVFRCIVGFTFQ